MKISVVLPTYDRGEILCNIVEMLLQQDFDEYEVIVVDQTPSYPPEVQKRLEPLLGRIRYYRLGSPNISAACNLGIRVAQAEIINFLDDEMIIPKDYLMLHYRNFVNANERIGGVMSLNLRPLQNLLKRGFSQIARRWSQILPTINLRLSALDLRISALRKAFSIVSIWNLDIAISRIV